MKEEFKLGDVVRDRITGFNGVLVAITHWLNGCVRITIQPRELKDGKTIDTETFDSQQIELVEPDAEPEKPKRGGPMPKISAI